MVKSFYSNIKLCCVVIFMTMSLIACQKDSGDSKSNSTLTSPQQYPTDRRQLGPLNRTLFPQNPPNGRTRVLPYQRYQRDRNPDPRRSERDRREEDEDEPFLHTGDQESPTSKGYVVETVPIYRPYDDAASRASGTGYAAGPTTTYQEGLPITTGAETEGRFYTDAQNDSVMSVLVKKVNSLKGSSTDSTERRNASNALQAASKKLAGAISEVDLQVSANNLSAKVQFQLINSRLSVQFSGSFAAGTHKNSRIVELTQTGGDSSFTFKAKALCVDGLVPGNPLSSSDGHSCYNVVLQLDQMQGSKKCATVYLVHRVAYDGNGDAHIVMNSATYHLFNEDPPTFIPSAQNDSLVKLETARQEQFPSQSARAFIKMITNTVYANEILLKGLDRTKIKKAPLLSKLSLRSWAVAYGPSYFEVLAEESAPQSATRVNYTLFYGALTKEKIAANVSDARSVEPQQIQVAGSYPQNTNPDDVQKLNFASQINWAGIIFNSGRGDISITCHFKPDPVPSGTTLYSIPPGNGAEFTFTVQRKTNPTLPAQTIERMLTDLKEDSK